MDEKDSIAAIQDRHTRAGEITAQDERTRLELSRKYSRLLNVQISPLKSKYPGLNWSEADEINDDDLGAAGDLYDRIKA